MKKPVIRVPAGSTPRPITPEMARSRRTSDSFQNFAAKVGIGAGNLSDDSGYGFNFITRNRIGLEAAYRGSWVVGAAVDYVADDMTNGGATLDADISPEDKDAIDAGMRDLQVWQKLGLTTRWGRLYGGSGGLLMIDGEDMSKPLNLDSITEGKFKGIFPMDRWMLNPNLGDIITDLGPELGMPRTYQFVSGAGIEVPGWEIHHTRLLRQVGIELPFQQKLTENMWGMSVLERLFDRLVAFDSTSAGAAQLVFKAHLRTLKIPQLRSLIAAGGQAMEGLLKQVEFMRVMQTNEGITLLDAEDEFEATDYSFTGLDDVLLQFGQQLAGALEMPLVRLFGQSPAGLNSTGESDLRTYYDGIHKKQETNLRRPVTVLYDIMSRSILGKPLPEGATFTFTPLYQPNPTERATIFAARTGAIVDAVDKGVVERSDGLREMKTASEMDGGWSQISDDSIKDAEDDPPIGEQIEAEMEPDPVMAPPGGKVAAMPKKAA